MRIALVNASVHTGGDHGTTISGDTLAELARKHQVAQSVNCTLEELHGRRSPAFGRRTASL